MDVDPNRTVRSQLPNEALAAPLPNERAIAWADRTLAASLRRCSHALDVLESRSTVHLVPLCLDACWHTRNGSLASLVTQRKQVTFAHLEASHRPDLRAALERVGTWALQQKPPLDRTSHWWPHQLSNAAEKAFHSVAHSRELMSELFEPLFPAASHVVQPLEGMNEVYVACRGHKNGNSDTVFYMNHVDGPYGVFPLVHVYRCMCACTPNGQVCPPATAHCAAARAIRATACKTTHAVPRAPVQADPDNIPACGGAHALHTHSGRDRRL